MIHALFARDIEKSFGDQWILRGCDLSLEPGECVGLVGVNGSGKSTLLSVLSGDLVPDHGTLQLQGSLASLTQDPQFTQDTVGDVLSDATDWHGRLVRSWEDALAGGDADAIAEAQEKLDLVGWEVGHKIDAVIDQLKAPPRNALTATLSGGERRRVALAATLLQQPDVLLLDEPTNHLDADTVEWLQRFLAGYRGAVLMVTHDRYLLEAVATRIIEVEHGKCVTYDGSYTDYLVARAELHGRQLQAEQRRLKMLAREAAWAARSPAARSTKQKARLERLEKLRERGDLPEDRDFQLAFHAERKLGGTLLEAHGLSKRFGDRVLYDNIDLSLLPGERIGIIGPNGAGKSTLLKSLLGNEPPDTGTVHRGPRVQIGVLDQQRTGLKDTDTVYEAAGDGNDHVQIGDHWIHVATFLERFLFTRDQFDMKVEGLSGGERARLLLARLMLQGTSLLFLDEPTNDLDLLTLRVLEEALLEFRGAAIIVTHDRAFLDRVCTGIMAFEGDGQVTRYASRVQAVRAAEEQRKQLEEAQKRAQQAAEKAKAAAKPQAPAPKRAKLSYKEKREFEQLPEDIEALENEQAELETLLADPSLYKDRPDEVPALTARLDAMPAKIEALYTRWEELSERA